MNNNIITGKWEEIKGKIKQQWGKVTDDDLMQAKGSYQEILGILQKRYGERKEQMEEELRKFFEKNNWK